ncbi:P1 family peptidase [Oceanibacterium hippocampi]|uniref:Peptidase family S58 n=1 Tax=Oceanibacterium hippocampi TaxID=745714 RepID=A0A1Y5RUK5_9PROT|nr:P1 family peptidase [Oceanibacterium hippocampi]SLN25430.1 Peptidase family S58 [Oceanibacterium hippocampi]
MRPGKRNLITDVDGLKVGNAADPVLRSGVTVVMPDTRGVAGVDVRGGGPGTRETEVLRPDCMVQQIDAICLSGGSVYGLDAASGVVGWLRRAGRGIPVHGHHVPIVPAAILFDLGNGGVKDWADESPYRALGRRAAGALDLDFDLGNVGAGYGAMAGRIKGGLGSVSLESDDGIVVGALVAANPVGSVTMPGTAQFWAWPFEQDDEFGGLGGPAEMPSIDREIPVESRLAGNTTIGVVATNVTLGKAEAQRVAMMAQDGLARAIRPIHTPFDGDTIFTLSTGKKAMPEPAPLTIARIGSMAADCVARAVARAIYSAETLGELRSYRSFHAGRTAG